MFTTEREDEFKIFQFDVDVCQLKSFTSSTLLFQLKDRVPEKDTLLPRGKLDHKK